MGFEKFVEIVEMRAHDIPMEFPSWGVQNIFVGEKRVENLNNGLSILSVIPIWGFIALYSP